MAVTRRLPRGQGVVELALGTLLVVSTLMLGIYLAEVGYLSLKVQEAGNFAALSATNERVHDFSTPLTGGNYATLGAIPPSVAGAAQARYRDFDGLTAAGGGSSVTYVFTRADNLTVSCAQTGANGAQFPFPGGGGNTGGRLRQWYQNRGAVACNAQARVADLRLPGRLLDGPGGFHEERLHDFTPLRICSVGRAVSGNCRGRYSLLLGDWSLDGPLNSQLSADMPWLRRIPDPPYPSGYPHTPPVEAPVPNHTELRNEPYWYMARELWELSGAGYRAGQRVGLSASMQMANAMEPARRYRASERLYDERQPNDDPRRLVPGEDFAFSYAGPERGSADVYNTTCPACHFNTNGTVTVDGPREGYPDTLGHRWNRDRRQPCFLGLDGC